MRRLLCKQFDEGANPFISTRQGWTWCGWVRLGRAAVRLGEAGNMRVWRNLVGALGLGPSVERRAGSSPVTRTMVKRYTVELLAPLVAEVSTFSELCRKLGIQPSTGAQSHLSKRVRELGIDTTHFKRSHPRGNGKVLPIETWLVQNSTMKSHSLRLRLIQAGIKESKCESCNLSEWMGETIPLELDHINSDHWDCRIENLQILCPNCHALTTRRRKASR